MRVQGHSSLNILNQAKLGLQRAMTRADQAGRRLSTGDISPDSVVEIKIAQKDLSFQVENIRAADEITGIIIDLIA